MRIKYVNLDGNFVAGFYDSIDSPIIPSTAEPITDAQYEFAMTNNSNYYEGGEFSTVDNVVLTNHELHQKNMVIRNQRARITTTPIFLDAQLYDDPQALAHWKELVLQDYEDYPRNNAFSTGFQSNIDAPFASSD